MTEQKKTGRSWEFGIWIFYGGFVLFILACVGFASMQQFDLVEDNYYERGIGYQTNIDTQNRTAQLPEQPVIEMADGKVIRIAFPASFTAGDLAGQLLLYRPSNSQYDRQMPLVLDSVKSMHLSMADLPTGLWKVKLNWQYAGQSYYNEETIIIE
ncbi:MAG: FixH family protein [bacterium]|nr:FixH family protein [bacterium]